MLSIQPVRQVFGSATARWSYDRVIECAEMCANYRAFYTRFPLPYTAAMHNGWISAIAQHCGWEKINGVTGPHQDWYIQNLKDVLEDDGSILPEAYSDNTWPMDLGEKSILSELV